MGQDCRRPKPKRQDPGQALRSPLRLWILKEALPKLVEAVGLQPDGFDLRLKLASLNHRLEKFDDAETQLASAAKLAEKDEEKDAILDARVKNDQAANRLAQRIEALNKELEATPQSTAPAWIMLARYLEADSKLPEAVRAAEKAVEIDPRSIGAWTLAARFRESAGSLGDAAEALRGSPRSTAAIASST